MPRYIEEDVIRQGKFHLNYLIPDGDKDDRYWYQLGWNEAINTVLDCLPKVDAIPLEDYKSMEQTVNKLTKAIADAEPTEEQVKEYCRKRGLVIVSSELFNEMKARWGGDDT